MSAIRPPGRSTRRISSRPANGSENRCRAAKQQRRRRSRRGTAARSRRRGSGRGCAGSVRRSSSPPRSSIVREPSMPSASPLGPTARANSRVKLPGPQATSSTVSPSPEPKQQPRDPHLLRHPRAGDALGHPPQRRAPVALVDRRHQPGDHQVLRGAGGLELALEQVEVAGVVDAPLARRARRRARRAARSRRSSAFAAAGLGGHVAARVARVAERARSASRSRARPRPAPGRSARQRRDQALDPVADLQREVRGRGAGERAHVLDRDPRPLSRSGLSLSLIS